MKLEDIDFEMSFENHKFKISELSDQDINQIEAIGEAILLEKILTCKVKAIICAFQLYIESLVETDDWLSKGNRHH